MGAVIPVRPETQSPVPDVASPRIASINHVLEFVIEGIFLPAGREHDPYTQEPAPTGNGGR